MIFATDKIEVRAILAAIAIGVTIHILVKKTKKAGSKDPLVNNIKKGPK